MTTGMTSRRRRRSVFKSRRMGLHRVFLPVLCFALWLECSNCGFLRSQGAEIRRDSVRNADRWNEFPSYRDTVELARISRLVYHFRGQGSCNATDSHGVPLLPPDLECHLYVHNTKQGTQLLIVTSEAHKYIAVVYAGTDDLRTMLADTDIMEKPFGPMDENGNSLMMPGRARVHAGFDNAVFVDGLYDMVLQTIRELHTLHKGHRIFTTGHSLGGADSVLTAVALANHYPSLPITSISFGCPKTGNRYWRDEVHAAFDNLSIWRFVHGWDLVPRLPEYPFAHVGHTVQMNPNVMNAYYFHNGNSSLGYAGVPLGWSSKVWIWLPGAMWSHASSKYELYLLNQSSVDPDTYFVDEFVPIWKPDMMDDDINDDDPAWNPPDDLFIRDDASEADGDTKVLNGWLEAFGALFVQ